MWDPERPFDLAAITESDWPVILEWFYRGIILTWEPLAVEAYLQGNVRAAAALGRYPGPAELLTPTDRQAIAWYQQQTLDYCRKVPEHLRESVKDIILQDLRDKENPMATKQRLLGLFEESEDYFELLARTEIATAENAGRIQKLLDEGEELGLVIPHQGACEACVDLLEGRVFRLQMLKDNIRANYGRKRKDWIPAVPQHPCCRHCIVPLTQAQKDALPPGPVPDEGIRIMEGVEHSIDDFEIKDL